MGSKSEDWWQGSFQKYSIKKFNSMSVYLKFRRCSSPYSKGDHNFREAYWKDDNCYIYEWFDRREQQGEKFGIDYNSSTHFYENWHMEDSIHVVIKSWLCGETEWGLVIKYYPDHEEHENWSVDRESKILESKKVFPDKTESITNGKKYTDTGLEDFTEKFWSTPDKSSREKTWNRGPAEGEEKEFKEEDKTWGESWEKDGPDFKKVEWNEEPGRKWGESNGKTGIEEWNKVWDRNPELDYEEETHKKPGKEWGTIRSMSNDARFLVEWEGQKPRVELPDSEDLTEGTSKKPTSMKPAKGKSLRSAAPDSQRGRSRPDEENEEKLKLAEENLAKAGQQLAAVAQGLKDDLSKRIDDFGGFELTTKEIEDLTNLRQAVEEISPALDHGNDSVLEDIHNLRKIGQDLDLLEKSILSSVPDLSQVSQAFSDLTSTASSLHSVIDPSNQTDFKLDLNRLTREFDSLTSSKQKFNSLSQLAPLLRGLLNFQSKNAADFDRKSAEITELLSSTLKSFEEVLQESQSTLSQIRSELKENEPESGMIEAAYAERSRKLINDIETFVPYTKTLPELSDLLRDMEKFKRELMKNRIAEDLKNLLNEQVELTETLLKGLKQPASPESLSEPAGINSALNDLGRKLADNKALALKSLGIDVKTGNNLIDQIKVLDPEERIEFNAKELLKQWWVNGQTEQITTGNTLKRLVNAVGTDLEKAAVDENLQKVQESLTGIVPDTDKQALDLLKASIEEFVPAKIHQSELLDEIVQKFEGKVKDAEIKPETLADLWKALCVADKIAEKLVSGDSPSALEEVRKQMESGYGKTDLPALQKTLLKYQEVVLGLINNDENLTAEELKELEDLAKKRAGGKGKSSGLKPKQKQALRSGRGGALRRINVADPSVDLIEKSLNSTGQLALWVVGARPQVQRHLQELQSQKDPVIKAIQLDGGSEEAIDGVLNFLSKLEDEKSAIVAKGDLNKNLMLVIQKSFKVLESTSSILSTSIPAEALELQNKPMTGDLSDLVKRVGFYLSLFFKMVKEATGASDEGDNLDEAMAGLMKKQVVSLLPFDPLHLLEDLKGKNNIDLKRLKFLAGLVGSESEIEACAEIEKRAVEVLHEFEPRDNQEAMQHIDHYLQTFPAIDKEISAETERMLTDLLEKLTNPEPLERDVNALISAAEKLDSAVKHKSPSDAAVQELSQRKENLPSQATQLVPYLTSLVNDYADKNLQLAGLEGKALAEELKKVKSAVDKKVKCAPVLVLREAQHLFAGPGVPDTVELILKLDKAVDLLMKTGTASDPSLFGKCIEQRGKLEALTPCELRLLAKDYSDLIIGIIDFSLPIEQIMLELEETTAEVLARRTVKSTVSLIAWADIFKARGLDLDAALIIDTMVQEQEAAKVYLQALAGLLGSADQKNYAKNLAGKSEEIMKIEDEAQKINNYFLLRLEQSKFMLPLNNKFQNLNERLVKLDSERGNLLKVLQSEVEILVEKNNPELKSQVNVIVNKEQENIAQNPENVADAVLRFTSRLTLEKELLRIKAEAIPTDNSEAELIGKLSELEQMLYSGLKTLWQSLAELSSQVSPVDLTALKLKTEPGVSTTIPALFGSLKSGAESLKDFSQVSDSLVQSTPIRAHLADLVSLLKSSSNTDDNETELVFSGLFRVVGSADDKAKSKKLRESRLLVIKESSNLLELSSLLSGYLQQFLPVRTSQSSLQVKLVKEAGNMRDSIDDVDLFTEDIMNKALREVANTIMPDDSKSKSTLDSIRKAVDSVNEVSVTNIPEIIERVNKRLQNWEKLERLRKDLREKQTKEINRLKGELQDKANEIETARATLEGARTQYEAQMTMLQNAAQQHSALIEKLTQEAIDKEKEMSTWKNKSADLANLVEELKEEEARLQDEVESNTKELRNLRRAAKDKDARIRELEENLEGHERTSENTSLGDKEKNEIFEKLKDELKVTRDELLNKARALEETEDKLGKVERDKQKVEIELGNRDKELDAVKKEKASLKADILALETQKSELLEKAKLNEGVSPEDLKQLERILEDKQQELEESEANLAVAKRYQLLYLEMTSEKQENDEVRRELEIQLTDLKRKVEDLKQENDQLKFKTRSADQAQKDLSSVQKENQKLQMRLDFLEKTNDKIQEASDMAKKLAEDLSSKDSQITDLSNEIERLKQEISKLIHKHNLSMSRSFLIRLCHAFKEQQGAAYRKWKVYKKVIPKTFEISDSAPVVKLHNEEENSFEDDYKIADENIAKENQELLQKNPVLALYNSLQDKGEKTLSVVSFYKFMEELMDKKFLSDKQDLTEQREIRSMMDFIPDYLTKTLGIQSLALKFLAQMVPSVHSLCADGHTYASFYARLMNLFHPDPIYPALAIYLVKVRMEFQPLLDKYERTMAEPVKKGDKKKKTQNSSKNTYDSAVNGGKALLTDVIELIYQLFAGDREGGLKALELLKPEKVTHEDFVAFKICHKMAKLGKTPEMIFNLLDKDHGGTIDSEEFITGTKDDLDLWISDENVKKLMAQLDKDGKGEVSKEAFLEKISMKALMQWNKDTSFAVTKASFLNALVEVHKFKNRKLAAKLNIEFKKVNKLALELNEFTRIVEELDSSLNKHDIEKMFHEAAGPGKKNVNLQQVIRVASKYGLGDVKSFRVRELLIQLARSKNLVGMIMGGEAAGEQQVEAKKKMISAFLSKKG